MDARGGVVQGDEKTVDQVEKIGVENERFLWGQAEDEHMPK